MPCRISLSAVSLFEDVSYLGLPTSLARRVLRDALERQIASELFWLSLLTFPIRPNNKAVSRLYCLHPRASLTLLIMGLIMVSKLDSFNFNELFLPTKQTRGIQGLLHYILHPSSLFFPCQ